VNDELRRAWDIVSKTGMPASRRFGKPLTEQEPERRLEGIVGARGSFAPRSGPVTTEIKCSDGALWVIDYDEQSPYQAFVGRRVIVSGFRAQPPMERRIGVTGHFAVTTMQLAESAPDAWLTEVGPPQALTGRFQREVGCTGEEYSWAFLTENDKLFQVANKPAGATIGGTVSALAYSVNLSHSAGESSGQFLWVICPWSYAQLGELRNGPNGGLPTKVYKDTMSGQLRWRPSGN
jgi:hypothetical protein